MHTNCGSFDSTLDWFERPESGVSAHYLVGLDGRLARIVAEGDTARHCGRVASPTAAVIVGCEDPNLVTVGIEFEDGGDPRGADRPAHQYEVGAELIAAIADRWQIPLDGEHVIGHREINATKDCPGNLDVGRLISDARSL